MIRIHHSLGIALLIGICVAFVWGVLTYLHTAPQDSEIVKELLASEDYFALGQYYFNHGDNADGAYDLDRARMYYTKALDTNEGRENAVVWYQLGRIDFIQGKFSSAIYKFNKQRERFGDVVPNVHYMLGLTYGYRAKRDDSPADWAKAEEHFAAYAALDPTDPWSRTDLSWVYFMQGKYEDMIPVVEEGLEHNPQHAWLLNMYGLAMLNTGDREAARVAFAAANEHAATLTVSDWGKAYPGNDPKNWEQGLLEMRKAFAANLALAEHQE